jgi:hypothetical protein
METHCRYFFEFGPQLVVSWYRSQYVQQHAGTHGRSLVWNLGERNDFQVCLYKTNVVEYHTVLSVNQRVSRFSLCTMHLTTDSYVS